MAEHTPGPWKAIPGATSGQDVIAPLMPKTRQRVAACGGKDRDANARLIAAAPDLLKAAQTVLAGLNARIDAADPGKTPVFCGIAALHDAITRAVSSDAGEGK